MNNINLLLLGESGSGKTTFINAIINYFSDEFESARQNGVPVAAPMSISYNCTDGKMRCLKVASTLNHESKNTYIKEYFATFEGRRIRLIDSPGFEESKTEEFNTTFKQIEHLGKLHGVCFFLKSSLSRRNNLFEYCVRQTLSALDIPVAKNIIFVLTNARSVQFSPSVARNVLTGFVESIKNKPPFVEIPLHDNNVFSMENESVLNLILESHRAKFRSETVASCAKSWNFSSAECRRLIKHVQGITPYRFFIDTTVQKKFLAENTYDLLVTFESNWTNIQKCKKLLNSSEAACRMVQEFQEQLKSSTAAQETSIPQNQSRKTIQQNSSEQRKPSKLSSNTPDKCGVFTGDDSKPKKSKHRQRQLQRKDPFQNDLKGTHMGQNIVDSGQSTAFKDSISEGNANGESYIDDQHFKRKMDHIKYNATGTNVDTDIQANLNKIMHTLKNQERFIGKVYEVVKKQIPQVISVLEAKAECSVFLENNATSEDLFEKHMTKLLSTLNDYEDADKATKLADLMLVYHEIKSKVSRHSDLDVTEEDIQNSVKKFENLQKETEIVNKIFNT